MNLRIIRGVALTCALFWPALALAEGDSYLEASLAGACESYIVADASKGNQALLNPASQALPLAEGFDKIAQTTPDKCQTCCTRNQATCQKQNGQHCDFKYTKCVAHCNKEGRIPSDWYCWWQPQMNWESR